ncbi:hypothetical protein QFZ77_005393 [Paenibacillus sp. V4I3]|nr:hypothetical protein [Paenibacillus sp. V4I3]MDQ0876734.1 hypothetical protein [Paenibacillus sp. V4I3]
MHPLRANSLLRKLFYTLLFYKPINSGNKYQHTGSRRYATD